MKGDPPKRKQDRTKMHYTKPHKPDRAELEARIKTLTGMIAVLEDERVRLVVALALL